MNEHGGTSPAAYSGWLNTSDILVSYQPFSRFFFSIFTVYLDDWERRRYERKNIFSFFSVVVCTRGKEAHQPTSRCFSLIVIWLAGCCLFPLANSRERINRYISLLWDGPDVYHEKKKKKKRKLTWKRCGPGCCPTSHKCTEALGNNSASRQSRRRDHRIWHGP